MLLFYLLICMMPLERHPLWRRHIGDLTLFQYLGVLCVLYAVFHVGSRRILPSFFRAPQTGLFVVFYSLAVASYLSKSLLTTLAFSPVVTCTSVLLLLFVTVSVVDTPNRLRWTLLIAIGSVALASLYVIREWQKYHRVYSGFRPGWIAGDANYFALYAVLCLPLAFLLAIQGRTRWERLFCSACLAVTLLAVMLGASRGGFIALAAAFLLVVWHSRKRMRNLVLASALALPLTLVPSASPLQRLLHPSLPDKEAEQTRIVAWKAGLQMIREHPLVGVGLGNFKPLMSRYSDSPQEIDAIAHNTYLEIAAEIGLPSLFIFVAILLCSFLALERVRRRTSRSGQPLLHVAALGIQAGLLGYAIAVIFLSAQYEKLLWLMVFLSMCLQSFLPAKGTRGSQPQLPAESLPTERHLRADDHGA